MVENMITYGRYPTLGEVCDYYSRDDFLEFLQQTCAVRKVVLVQPARQHWEPDWEQNRVPSGTIPELREFILNTVREKLPDVRLDERPPFYLSFHQTMDHWPSGGVDRDSPSAVTGCVRPTRQIGGWPSPMCIRC